VTSIRSKFIVSSVTKYNNSGAASVKLQPVYSADPASENKAFWDATPNGSIELHIQNPAAAERFVPGQAYYVDFTPAE